MLERLLSNKDLSQIFALFLTPEELCAVRETCKIGWKRFDCKFVKWQFQERRLRWAYDCIYRIPLAMGWKCITFEEAVPDLYNYVSFYAKYFYGNEPLVAKLLCRPGFFGSVCIEMQEDIETRMACDGRSYFRFRNKGDEICKIDREKRGIMRSILPDDSQKILSTIDKSTTINGLALSCPPVVELYRFCLGGIYFRNWRLA